MVNRARYFKSPSGPYADVIPASEIKSRQAAAAYGWFRSEEGEPLVYVRRAIGRNKSQHFSRLPAGKRPRTERQAILEQIQRPPGESDEHKAAKAALVAALNAHREDGEQIPWAFKDPKLAYPFTGQLLAGIDHVKPEHHITLPNDMTIIPDVVLMATDAGGDRYVKWAIEVMREHELDTYKMFKINMLGLPTIVLDIADLALDDITEEWAAEILAATCRDHERGQRKSFVYLPDILRTIYNPWSHQRVRKKEMAKHKFVVFGAEGDVVALRDQLEADVKRLGASNVHVQKRSHVGATTQAEFENARRLVPKGWVDVTGDSYLLIVAPRPAEPGPYLDFHHLLAQRLAANGRVVAGYDPKGGDPRMGEDADPWLAYVVDRRLNDRGMYDVSYPPLVSRVVCYPTAIGLEDRPKRKQG